MKCDKCKEEIKEYSSYCNYCGNKIESDTDKTLKRLEEIIITIRMFFELNPEIHKEFIKFMKKLEKMKKKKPKDYDKIIQDFKKITYP